MQNWYDETIPDDTLLRSVCLSARLLPIDARVLDLVKRSTRCCRRGAGKGSLHAISAREHLRHWLPIHLVPAARQHVMRLIRIA